MGVEAPHLKDTSGGTLANAKKPWWQLSDYYGRTEVFLRQNVPYQSNTSILKPEWLEIQNHLLQTVWFCLQKTASNLQEGGSILTTNHPIQQSSLLFCILFKLPWEAPVGRGSMPLPVPSPVPRSWSIPRITATNNKQYCFDSLSHKSTLQYFFCTLISQFPLRLATISQ